MGNHQTARSSSFDASGEVNFDHFQILRAIGRGSFGKVCIVKKKDSEKTYAMKYTNKNLCSEKCAVKNVLEEIELLQVLRHPFLVNLWFTFEDEEDLFIVVDLLVGGDLRFHLQNNRRFTVDSVRLFLAEMALVLDYLRSKKIIHRDLKPDNILLDDDGHCHLTDFNVATRFKNVDMDDDRNKQVCTSGSGTKPYMSPQVLRCINAGSNEKCNDSGNVIGYSYEADWWSLGICAYELLRNHRPFNIQQETNYDNFKSIYYESLPSIERYLSKVSEQLKDIILSLLEFDSDKRLVRIDRLSQFDFFTQLSFDDVLNKRVTPTFIPSKETLNCDPTFELEEMIIESKPLHKKKRRLAKNNMTTTSTSINPFDRYLKDNHLKFIPYDRQKRIEETISS